MICLDLMKGEVAFVTEHDDVQTAARLMQQRAVGFLPVCDEQRKPVGALTDRDIALRVCSENLRASEVPVSQAMTRRVYSCRPLDDVKVAEELMARHEIWRVMLVGDDGTLVGVVSLSDIAEAEEPARAAETFKDVVSRQPH